MPAVATQPVAKAHSPVEQDAAGPAAREAGRSGSSTSQVTSSLAAARDAGRGSISAPAQHGSKARIVAHAMMSDQGFRDQGKLRADDLTSDPDSEDDAQARLQPARSWVVVVSDTESEDGGPQQSKAQGIFKGQGSVVDLTLTDSEASEADVEEAPGLVYLGGKQRRGVSSACPAAHADQRQRCWRLPGDCIGVHEEREAWMRSGRAAGGTVARMTAALATQAAAAVHGGAEEGWVDVSAQQGSASDTASDHSDSDDTEFRFDAEDTESCDTESYDTEAEDGDTEEGDTEEGETEDGEAEGQEAEGGEAQEGAGAGGRKREYRYWSLQHTMELLVALKKHGRKANKWHTIYESGGRRSMPGRTNVSNESCCRTLQAMQLASSCST